MSGARDGRQFVVELTASVEAGADGTLSIRSPAVGLYRGGPLPGDVVVPGRALGELEILGTLVRLRAGTDARGVVVELGGGSGCARRAVGFGDTLLVLDPSSLGATLAAAGDARSSVASSGGLVFRVAMHGRFYRRPGPDRPAFVEPGDEVRQGQTIGLLEVMKTFHRLVYPGTPEHGLPPRARVRAVVPGDESEVAAGDVILELEPIDGGNGDAGVEPGS